MDINNINNKLIEQISMPTLDRLEKMGDSSDDKPSFKNIIQTEMQRLNDIQVHADNMNASLIAGNADDLHDVLIATEEARLSLELAVQVRNKFVEAYKEINNMQL